MKRADAFAADERTARFSAARPKCRSDDSFGLVRIVQEPSR